jgi:hypothetical protein
LYFYLKKIGFSRSLRLPNWSNLQDWTSFKFTFSPLWQAEQLAFLGSHLAEEAAIVSIVGQFFLGMPGGEDLQA